MLFDKVHEETDGKDRHEEGHGQSDNKIEDFPSRKAEAELDQLEKAGPEHDRDSQKEGVFGGQLAVHAQKDAPQDGRAGPGGTGDQGQDLENADEKGCFDRDLGDPVDGGGKGGVSLFDDDEKHAVDDEHEGHDHIIIKMLIQPVI